MLLLLLACSEPIPEPAAPTATAFEEGAASAPLTDLSAEAVAMSPTWVQDDLALALALQEDWRADELAALIVDQDEPWLIDEIAFVIAHISPEVLADDKTFYPELITENAWWVYEVEPQLSYVELVEEQDGQDDWYTTTRYTVMVDGVEQTRTLSRDDYYWFVVHPRVEDEHPWFIDPWAWCPSSGLECAATPETGMFWREFLWEAARDTCPVEGFCPTLDETLPNATFLWDGGGEGAIGDIARFMLSRDEDGTRWLRFGAEGERSIQPNRIYGLGRGNCGEWADMTTAISRTGLIPNVNVTPSSWDHTWNAFWDERWVAWEPVNFWIDHDYGSNYATYATRGDTLIWMQSEDYADTVGTLEVSVTDANGDPVDGATVAIFSPSDDSWWYAGERITDLAGVASFTLGADKSYAYIVRSAIGDDDGVVATNALPADTVTQSTVALAGTIPAGPELTLVELDAPNARGVLSATVDDVSGRVHGQSVRFDDETSTMQTDAPELDVFIVDDLNLDRLTTNNPVEAIAWNEVDGVTVKPKETWHVVVMNDRSNSTAAVGTLSASMDDEGETSVGELRFRLHPGEWATLTVSPE